MTATLALTRPVQTPLRVDRAGVCARLALYGGALQPPSVEAFEGENPACVVEALYLRVSASARVPALAARELIENLVHAGFRGALVSVLDDGLTVRVSDQGPGIPDKDAAMQPGFSTAGPAERVVVRGVGCGLPLAAALIAAVGGSLELSDNLDGGTVATLAVSGEPTGEEEPALGDCARRLLALLMELGQAPCEDAARELALSVGECGRELALLEHRGLVRRGDEGGRALTERGTSLVETLF